MMHQADKIPYLIYNYLYYIHHKLKWWKWKAINNTKINQQYSLANLVIIVSIFNKWWVKWVQTILTHNHKKSYFFLTWHDLNSWWARLTHRFQLTLTCLCLSNNWFSLGKNQFSMGKNRFSMGKNKFFALLSNTMSYFLNLRFLGFF